MLFLLHLSGKTLPLEMHNGVTSVQDSHCALVGHGDISLFHPKGILIQPHIYICGGSIQIDVNVFSYKRTKMDNFVILFTLWGWEITSVLSRHCLDKKYNQILWWDNRLIWGQLQFSAAFEWKPRWQCWTAEMALNYLFKQILSRGMQSHDSKATNSIKKMQFKTRAQVRSRVCKLLQYFDWFLFIWLHSKQQLHARPDTLT